MNDSRQAFSKFSCEADIINEPFERSPPDIAIAEATLESRSALSPKLSEREPVNIKRQLRSARR
jgi:hypothetical protein